MMNNIYLEALRELVSVFPVPLADYPDVAKKVHDALSRKPRNCDVGTAEEQVERWKGFCKTFTADCRGCPCLKSKMGISAYCFSKWSQMLYEEALEK